jgi:hypothetical protein
VTPPTGNEFGWRAHAAIQGWTASVDAKASIVLVVETALTGAGASALITGGGELHGATGAHLVVAVLAVAVLALSAASSLWVVFPRLERRTLTSTGLIYFGHLAPRASADIADALERMTAEDERAQLAAQLQVTSAVAWRKHAWLQRSIALLAIGTILLLISFTACQSA